MPSLLEPILHSTSSHSSHDISSQLKTLKTLKILNLVGEPELTWRGLTSPEQSVRWSMCFVFIELLPAPQQWPKKWWSPKSDPAQLISQWIEHANESWSRLKGGEGTQHQTIESPNDLTDHQARGIVKMVRSIGLSVLSKPDVGGDREIGEMIYTLRDRLISAYTEERLKWEEGPSELQDWVDQEIWSMLGDLTKVAQQDSIISNDLSMGDSMPRSSLYQEESVEEDLDGFYGGMIYEDAEEEEEISWRSVEIPDAIEPEPEEMIAFEAGEMIEPEPEEMIDFEAEEMIEPELEPPPVQAPSPARPAPQRAGTAQPSAPRLFGSIPEESVIGRALKSPVQEDDLSMIRGAAAPTTGAPAPISDPLDTFEGSLEELDDDISQPQDLLLESTPKDAPKKSDLSQASIFLEQPSEEPIKERMIARSEAMPSEGAMPSKVAMSSEVAIPSKSPPPSSLPPLTPEQLKARASVGLSRPPSYTLTLEPSPKAKRQQELSKQIWTDDEMTMDQDEAPESRPRVELPVATASAMEIRLGEDAAHPGPLERVLKKFKRITKGIYVLIGLRVLILIQLIDSLWELVSGYIQHIFQIFMTIRSARRVRQRLAAQSLTLETEKDILSTISYLESLLCLPELDPWSSELSAQDHPLAVALTARAQLDDLRRDLRFMNSSEIKRGVLKTIYEWLIGLIPNPLQLFILWKNWFILRFKLSFRRREVLRVFQDFKEECRGLLDELRRLESIRAARLKGGEDSIDLQAQTQRIKNCRRSIDRLFFLTLLSHKTACPNMWRPLDWVEDLLFQHSRYQPQPQPQLQEHTQPQPFTEAQMRRVERLELLSKYTRDPIHPLTHLSLNQWLLERLQRGAKRARHTGHGAVANQEFSKKISRMIAVHRVHRRYAQHLRHKMML